MAIDVVGQGTGPTGANSSGRPEVVAICITEAERNRGVGKRMLKAIEAYLAELGSQSYLVRTDDRPDNRAIAFYVREGFRTIGKFHAHGNSFQLMAKDLGVQLRSRQS
jgi:GNAT superfamily N-acetyltransferase